MSAGLAGDEAMTQGGAAGECRSRRLLAAATQEEVLSILGSAALKA